MNAWLTLELSNAVVATGIAIVAMLVARWGKRPNLAHALWLMVFIKLITPPLFPMKVVSPDALQGLQATGAVAIKQVLTSAEAQPRERSNPTNPIADTRSVAPASPRAVNNDDATVALRVNTQVPIDPLELRDGGARQGRVANPNAWAPQRERPPSKTKRLELSESDATDSCIVTPVATTPWTWIRRGLFVVWLVGSLWYLTQSFTRWRAFARLVHEAAPADARLRQFVNDLSARVGLATAPTVRVVSGNLSPMVFASGRRTYLIVPRDLVNWLSDKSQFETLIAHELAHILRRDHWVRWLELFVTCLFWWLPTVWLAKRGIREAEEEICDAWVVTMLPQAHRTYAEALLNTADFLNAGKLSLPPMTSAISHFRFIKRRIVMIMQGSVPTRLAWTSRLLVWTLGAALLPLSIGFAQSNEQDESKFQSVEGVIAAKKAEAQRKLSKRIAKQDDDDAIDAQEIEEILAEVRKELESELGGLDEEIREAMEEVQEELQEELDDAPPELQKLLSELDINAMLDEAMADAPKPIRSFVKSLNIEGMIAEALQDVDLEEIEIDEEQMREIKAELERELGQELKQEMAEMSQELAEARREVQEAMQELPPEARAMLKQLDLKGLLRDSLGESSPLVEEIVEEVGILEIIEDALEDDGESADEVEEEVEESDDDDKLDAAEDKLQRRLDELMKEVDAIRKELKQVKRMRK